MIEAVGIMLMLFSLQSLDQYMSLWVNFMTISCIGKKHVCACPFTVITAVMYLTVCFPVVVTVIITYFKIDWILGMYDGGEHTPKLLPCSHTVCLQCLDRIVATFARDTGQFRFDHSLTLYNLSRQCLSIQCCKFIMCNQIRYRDFAVISQIKTCGQKYLAHVRMDRLLSS